MIADADIVTLRALWPHTKVHTARKAGVCEHRRCAGRIEVGAQYADGDPVYGGNPWQMQRWCEACVHAEAEGMRGATANVRE